MSRLLAIVKVLKETSFYHTSKLADADMALLVKILKSWPPQMLFPGISSLDLEIVSIIVIGYITLLNCLCKRRKKASYYFVRKSWLVTLITCGSI